MERLGTQLAWANEGLLYSGLQSCAPFRIHKKSFLHWTQNPILSICSSLSSSAIYKENHLWLTHNVFIIEDCVRYTGYPIIVFPDIVCSQVFLVTVVTMIVIYIFFIIIFHLKKKICLFMKWHTSGDRMCCQKGRWRKLKATQWWRCTFIFPYCLLFIYLNISHVHLMTMFWSTTIKVRDCTVHHWLGLLSILFTLVHHYSVLWFRQISPNIM